MMPNVDQEVERILHHLREKMRQKNWSQLEVQEELGWGRSYISQLMTRQKMLRVEQITQILRVIGVTPAQFYLDLYGKDWDAWEEDLAEWERRREEEQEKWLKRDSPDDDDDEWEDDELPYDVTEVREWSDDEDVKEI